MYDLIFLMAGSSLRFEKANKLFIKACGKEIYKYSLEKFLVDKDLEKIILVVDRLDIKYPLSEKIILVKGGLTRADSVRNGLKNVQAEFVMIHDGARPMVKKSDIDNFKKSLLKNDVVSIVGKTFDSVRYQDALLDRNEVYLMKTPQGGKTEIFQKAYEHPGDFKDDVEAVKCAFNLNFFPVIESEPTFKITTYSDFLFFEKLLLKEVNHGKSFDIHEFSNEKTLILGGISFPGFCKLKAHSDGDVLVHAITEALIGALKMGDLGAFFPDNSSEYKDIYSLKLLKKIKDLLTKRGFFILGIDTELMCEEPKISKYTKKLKENIANTLNIDLEKINIKATTFEKIGDIGNKKAIGALAIATIGRR